MSKQSVARANLLAKAEKFREDNLLSDGELSNPDFEIYSAMLNAADTMAEGGIRTQAQLDANPPEIRGVDRGVQLVDQNGRICRTLGKGESYADAIRNQPAAFGVSQDQIKYCDDGLTIGGYMAALVDGPRTSAERWALSESGAGSGGYAVPAFLSAQIIDRFRVRSVVGRAGAQTLPLTTAENSFAKLTGGATASWRQELTTIAESSVTFGRMTMYPRSLAVEVKASRELIADAPNIATLLERELSDVMAQEVDRVAMLGIGAEAEPLGLKNWADLNEITGVAALTDYSDFIDGAKLLMDDNAPDSTAAIVSNREWATLNKLEDTTGQPLQLPPAIRDLPFLSSSKIPTNLGGGGNESFSLMGYFPDLVLGMRQEIVIDVLRELHAQTHELGYIAHLRMDTGVFHAESFVRLLGITP
jgi:HK97 family phage major capsid protein